MDRTAEEVAFVWAFRHRRLMLACLCGLASFVSLGFTWIAVSGTTSVINQLSYLAGGGLFGLFLINVAGIAYWAEQRERELEALRIIEDHLAHLALELGLAERAEPFEVDLEGRRQQALSPH